MVKWEPDAPEVVQGVEPFAHISPAAEGLGPRRRGWSIPARRSSAQDELMLFTEKLNVKRARHGGPIVLHQDFPYWEPLTPVASRIATAMVFLDDATMRQRLPGSRARNAQGRASGRSAPTPTASAAWRWTQARSTSAGCSRWKSPPGTVAFFGAFLVHRSAAQPHRWRPPRPAATPTSRAGAAACGWSSTRCCAPTAAARAEAGAMTRPDFGPPPPPTFDIAAQPATRSPRSSANGFLAVERLTTDEELAWLRRIFEYIFDPANAGKRGAPLDRSGAQRRRRAQPTRPGVLSRDAVPGDPGIDLPPQRQALRRRPARRRRRAG